MSTSEKYIVLIGETGSGKSTFINYVTNYFNRGKIGDLKIAIPTRFHSVNMDFRHEEQSVRDITTSKTVNCQCYTFQLEDLKFHFIDTPGINDTGEFVRDSRNVEKIFEYMEQLPEITALILFQNGAVSRTTVNMRNVLSTLQQRIPDIVYNNMLIVLTNCQPHTVSFRPSDFSLPTECAVFHMQNSAFSSDSQSWPKETRQIIERDFKNSINAINQLIVKFLEFQPQTTANFKDMNNDRHSIKRELHDARLMLMELRHLEDELMSYELSANIHNMNMEKFQNFVQSKTVTQFKRFPSNYYSTTCSMCNKTCHENCRLNETPSTGDKTFLRCLVMKRGSCQECGCVATRHYHDRSIIQPVTCTIEQVVSSLEKRYREAKIGKDRANTECNNIQKTKKIIEYELKIQYDKVKSSVERLRQTCSGVNISEELYDFIVSLKKDVATLKTHYAINQTNTFIAHLKQLCDDMENTEIPTTTTTTNNDDRHHSPPRPAPRKSRTAHSHNTLVSPTLTNSDISRAESAVAKSIESFHPKSKENFAETIDPSSTDIAKTEQPSNLQVQHTASDDEKFFDAKNSFHPQQNADAEIIPSQIMSNSSPEKEEKEATQEIVTVTEENEVNYTAFTLSELIQASKRIRNKGIRKELDQRCQGNSLGLLSKDQHMQLCKYFAEFQSKTLQERTSEREVLEDRIQKGISNDPFNIDKVSEAMLLQLAAVKLSIRASPAETSV